MKLRKNAKILGRVVNALFVATCLLAHGAWATEITWKGSTGGDMQVGTNWNGDSVPTSSDSLKVNKNQSAPITLSEDQTGADAACRAREGA